MRGKKINNSKKASGTSMSQIARKDLVRLLFPLKKRDLKTKVLFMLRSNDRNMNSYDGTNRISDYFIMSV